MSANILQFRKKPAPHSEYEAWTEEREKNRREFEKLQVPEKANFDIDWSHELEIPVSIVVGVCCFTIGIVAGIMIGIAASS